MLTIYAIAKRMLSSNKISFIITAAVVLCATTSGSTGIALSNGNYTWLLALMAPFFVVFYDYAKLVHLGTSKRDYFIGSLVSYTLFAVLISFANTVIYLLIDPLNKTQTVINLIELCGWNANGIFIAFFQQTLFLLLVMIFLHVLLFMQPYWYGWLTDILLIAVICIFTPIAPLRRVLVGFFRLIMFNPSALLHSALCLFLSAALALGSLLILKRKAS